MSQPIDRYGVLPSMMSWAESAAREHGITREECDRWALQSHRKACAAIEEGRFLEEIVPVAVPQTKGGAVEFAQDEAPRKDATLVRLAELKPVLGGVCTAGNSSSESDGAAAVVVMSEEKAQELALPVLARPISFGLAAADPRETYKAVPVAASKALQQTGLTMDDMALIEVQEAFASQVLADLIEMGIDERGWRRVNVNGSGISLGHPIACTGVRVLVSLINEMRRRDVRYGLECICGGGGLGIAAVLERGRG
ncbi:MAG: thiolase family protein [Desulfomonilaceae bacterium]